MGWLNNDLADLKAEYEDNIRKYIGVQDLVGKYFITDVNNMETQTCVNDAYHRKQYFYNIYKVIEQNDEGLVCRFIKVSDEITHELGIDEHVRILAVNVLDEWKISNLSFAQTIYDEYTEISESKPYLKMLLDSDIKLKYGCGYIFRGDDKTIEEHIKEFIKERNGRNG